MTRITAFLTVVIVLALAASGTVSAQDPGSNGSGQLAITGADGNIHLYDVAANTFTPLTDDAEGDARFYSWPTWATDGQLAYFGTSQIDDPPYRLGIFVKPANGTTQTEAVQVYQSGAEVFTYAYWSPGECPVGNCRDLAVLYTGADGNLAVRRVRSTQPTTATDATGADERFSIEELATGGPFYWDWSPDGQTMFWARFGERLEIYDVAGNTVVQTFDETQGFQRSVDWSPVDDRLLTAVNSGFRRSDLVVFDGEERQVLAAGIRGILSYEWSPDGTQVAYTDGEIGNLYVVDAASGDELALVSSDVIAFFWSPVGSRLAYITLSREKDETAARQQFQQGSEGDVVARWFVYDMASGISSRFAGFLPSRDMIYYLQFFDQFARSHRLWSPDGRYIVYGALTRDSEEQVELIDTTQPGSPPQTLMAGGIGVFSWN